jgi:hypothetical protein
MVRADPHPPVVVVTGDLLAHDIRRQDAVATAVRIARRLDRAFPQAQFVLALGNNDSACGDYALAPDAPFLQEIAAAWEPLVNRGGAAPAFARTFAHDGYYTARLPLAGLRAVVVDDVFWSARYHAGCGPAGEIAKSAMNELDATLRRTPGPLWVLFHIPPGVDAFSTAHIVHDLAVVPFFAPAWRDRLLAALELRPGSVALAVGAHTHRFAYRIVDASGPRPVPMLLVPAISPIYGNAPSFLTANVAAGGVLHHVEEFSYRRGAWANVGGMPTLGVEAFTGAQLVALQGRLAADPALRHTFGYLYGGGVAPEIDERNWRIYWCAATAFGSTAFRACDHAGGVSVITGRGVVALASAGAIVIVAGGGIAWGLRRRVARR